MTWPDAVIEADPDRWPTTTSFADHLFALARRVAAAYPHIDIWDHLENSLRRAMKGYDPSKGPFEKLFAETLRERLWRAGIRRKVKDGRRRRAEEAYSIVTGAENESTAFTRWADIILHAACAKLDDQTRTFVLMRHNRQSFAAIADALNTTEQALKNKFGGKKLVTKARSAVRRLVTGLTERQRQVLVRHLVEEAELSPEQVEQLLMVQVHVEGDVPLMEEDEVLKFLGWSGDF